MTTSLWSACGVHSSMKTFIYIGMPQPQRWQRGLNGTSSSTTRIGRTRVSATARRQLSTGPDLSHQPNKNGQPLAFSTASPGHGGFEFIAFLGKLVAEDNSHDQPLATEVVREGRDDGPPLPQPLRHLRGARVALQRCPILRTDGGQSIRSILFSSVRGLDIGVKYSHGLTGRACRPSISIPDGYAFA